MTFPSRGWSGWSPRSGSRTAGTCSGWPSCRSCGPSACRGPGRRRPRPSPPAPPGRSRPTYLPQSRVADLHGIGYRGQGTRVAVVASEFPGVLGMVGRQLPANTRVIDLTAELNPDLLPNPADPNRPGVGTVAALAASAPAPAAELLLVRVDPTAFHQLLTVARAVAGDPSYSEAMQSRSQELIYRAESLTTRRAVVTAQYQRAFTSLSDEPAAVKARQEARAALDQLVADEQAYNAAVERFTAVKDAVDSPARDGRGGQHAGVGHRFPAGRAERPEPSPGGAVPAAAGPVGAPRGPGAAGADLGAGGEYGRRPGVGRSVPGRGRQRRAGVRPAGRRVAEGPMVAGAELPRVRAVGRARPPRHCPPG